MDGWKKKRVYRWEMLMRRRRNGWMVEQSVFGPEQIALCFAVFYEDIDAG